jgi:hypothetical protein
LCIIKTKERKKERKKKLLLTLDCVKIPTDISRLQDAVWIDCVQLLVGPSSGRLYTLEILSSLTSQRKWGRENVCGPTRKQLPPFFLKRERDPVAIKMIIKTHTRRENICKTTKFWDAQTEQSLAKQQQQTRIIKIKGSTHITRMRTTFSVW